MPKDESTPRNELICGKIENLISMIMSLDLTDSDKYDLTDILADIQNDAQRMEAKLIIRKQEQTKPL